MADWVIKSVSVEPRHAIIINQSKMNLSRFVRGCLDQYEADLQRAADALKHTRPAVLQRLGHCGPNSMCRLCFPNGEPTLAAWRMFRGQPTIQTTASVEYEGGTRYDGPEVGDLDWLRAQTDSPLDLSALIIHGNEKATKAQKPKSGLRAWFRSIIPR